MVIEVVWSLFSHRRVTAHLYNGIFILDYTEIGARFGKGGGPAGRLSAYGRLGRLLYKEPRISPRVCYATPKGDHLEPEPDNAHCQPAVAW